MSSKKEAVFDVSERPISNVNEDCFDTESRIVSKIYNFIQDVCTAQLTMAITGEWGVGKSSVINLLVNKLKEDKQNIVIIFEPLLEGKFEIADIMGLFYVKLYQNLKDTTVRDVIKSCLKSAAIISRVKITGTAELDASAIGVNGAKLGGKIEYNWGDNIDALLKLWDKEKPKNFSEQTKELNDSLQKNNYKLYIVLDEIDRLPAEYIIHFLLFCRVLESFDNLICIVGIDYEQVISKLTNESSLGEYERAQGYLDKLFQAKFHVSHNKYKKMEFAKNRLLALDSHNLLKEILTSNDYKILAGLDDIFSYLSTPRQIKKWIISLVVNYPILKYSPDKLRFMAFLAVTVKHPIVTDYLSKHVIKMLSERNVFPYSIMKEYGIDFSNHKDANTKILVASLGFRLPSRRADEALETKLDELTKILKVQKIVDATAAHYLEEYLNTPRYLIALFVEGFSNENQVGLFNKFFSSEIDEALEMLRQNDSNIYMLVSDLAVILQKGYGAIKSSPQISCLNDLWKDRVNDSDFFGNPYEVIVLFCLRKLSLETVIAECPIAMSESHISSILHQCAINNQNGIYDLNSFKVPSDDDAIAKGMQELQFNGVAIVNFTQDTIKNLLESWISKVEEALQSNQVEVYTEPKLISVFYRYVQWGVAMGNDQRKKLANYINNYLKDHNVSDGDKEYLKDILRTERKKFSNKILGIEKDPMDTLFDNNSEVMEHIK